MTSVIGEAAGKMETDSFALADVMKAYDTFGNAAKENALKIVLKAQPKRR